MGYKLHSRAPEKQRKKYSGRMLPPNYTLPAGRVKGGLLLFLYHLTSVNMMPQTAQVDWGWDFWPTYANQLCL